MIELKRVTKLEEKYFQPCWELYEAAFPIEERRSLEYHLETMESKHLHFDAIIEGELFIGILSWWDFDSIRYIEHLATRPELRGGGYGAQALQHFIALSSKPIFLEVEHPDGDTLRERRIGFYERLGFFTNHHLRYAHPSYDATQNDFLSLLPMSYPTIMSEAELHEFMSHFPTIHFRHYNGKKAK